MAMQYQVALYEAVKNDLWGYDYGDLLRTTDLYGDPTTAMTAFNARTTHPGDRIGTMRVQKNDNVVMESIYC